MQIIPMEYLSKEVTGRKKARRMGSLEGQNLIDADYDIDECNDEITKMFGVMIEDVFAFIGDELVLAERI